MPIKNYTTKISVYTSLAEIQGALASHGVRKIMIDYDEAGQPVGVMFGIEAAAGPMGFRLPANIDGVMAAFARQKVRVDKEQASMTAWRNIRDWVLAQMAFVEAGNVQIDEVFFPYLTDKNGNTAYNLYSTGRLRLGDGRNEL